MKISGIIKQTLKPNWNRILPSQHRERPPCPTANSESNKKTFQSKVTTRLLKGVVWSFKWKSLNKSAGNKF